MNALEQKVKASKNLDELLTALNEYEEEKNEHGEIEEWDRLENQIDLCDLPNFGKEPEDTMEIYSWDDTRVLIQNTCIDEDGPFILQERTEDFGK